SVAAGRTGYGDPVADGDGEMVSTFSNRPMRTRLLRAFGVLGSALIAVTLATGSASATIVERDSDSGPYAFTNWDCGYPLQVEGVFSDDWQVRADKQNADIVYVTTHHSFKETWTAEDGRSFTLEGHNLYKDVKAK